VKSRVNVWRQRAGLLAVSALFLIANAAFLIAFRSITSAQARGLEDRRSSLTSEVASREAEAAKLGSERDRLAGVSAVIEEFYGRRVGSRRETLAPMVEEIHAVMRKVGVAPKSIGYSVASVANLPLSQMVIGFSFQSDYARFKRLLQAFESNRRWIVVKEISLSRDSETPGEVQVRVTLATYFTADDGPVAPAPGGPAAAARTTARTVERTVRR
jgi:hypothetical protein